MAPHKSRGPASLSEWIVGASISSALGPIPKVPRKQKRRDVVKVLVTTDDETEEDSLQITYPRTGRSKPVHKPVEAVVKKVRFEDSPRKSALKKVKATPVESGGETTDSSMGTVCSVCGSEPSVNDTSSEAQSSDTATTSSKNKSKKAKPVESEESDVCPTCKAAKGSTKSETDSSETNVKEPPKKKKDSGTKRSKKQDKPDSDTDTNTPEPQPKSSAKSKDKKAKKSKSEVEAEKAESETEPAPTGGKLKGKKKVVEPDSDNDTTDSAKESDAEPVKPNKKEKNKKKQDTGKPEGTKKPGKEKKQEKTEGHGKSDKKNKQGKQPKTNGEEVSPESSGDESSCSEVPQSKNEKKKKKNKQQKKSADDSKKDNTKKEASWSSQYRDMEKHYPEYFPGSHVRRPNLIEPIRAEVLQTEKVVETPEDPPPNAYYDPVHGIIRVYYGPVYGKPQAHALYPRRDSSNLPLPIGVPHPTENPYYFGFNKVNQQQGYNHVPVTQGMPPPTPWAGMCPPPNLFPGQYGSLPQGIPLAIPPSTPWECQKKDAAVQHQTGPPSSKDKDKDGRNNVVPEPTIKTGTDNPYYSRKESMFSSFGKRTASNKSRKSGTKENSPTSWEKTNNDGAVDWGAPDPNQLPETNTWEAVAQPTNDQWQTIPDNSWGGNNDTTWQTNNDPQGTWGDQSKASNGSRSGSKRDHWDAIHKWDTQSFRPRSNNGSNKGSVPGSNQGSVKSKKDDNPPVEENNVMPGTWVDTPNVMGPTWGDTSAAVDTHGEVTNW